MHIFFHNYHKVRILFIGAVLCLCLALQVMRATPAMGEAAKTDKQKVVQVKDGDSLVVVNNHSKKTIIRLYGIDSPEYSQPGGQEAKAFTSSFALFKEVSITPIDKDKYGRVVALVGLPSGKTLNAELLRSGNAWYYGYFCKQAFCEDWKRIEKTAKAEKKGLWQQQNPTPPWKWRRQHKSFYSHKHSRQD